jgi:hypothetical protein
LKSYGFSHTEVSASIATYYALIRSGDYRTIISPVKNLSSTVHTDAALKALFFINGGKPLYFFSWIAS